MDDVISAAALPAALALFTSAGVCLAAVILGRRLGYVDPADDLKTHRHLIVPLGGIGVLAGTGIGMALAGAIELPVAGGALLLVLLGTIDDRRPLAPGLRLMVEAGAGVIVAAGADGDLLTKAAVTVAVVVMVNAINLIDGIDTITGLVTMTALLSIAVAALLRETDPTVAVIAFGAVAGFLVFNLPPARLILGDGGAYLCGLIIVVAAADSGDGTISPLIVSLGLASAPLFEVISTFGRRLRRSAALFMGDRDHSYDRMTARLGSPVATALVFSGAQAGAAALVIATERATSAAIAALVAMGGLIMAAVVSILRQETP